MNWAQFAIVILGDLGRKILEDVLFHSSQNERQHLSVQGLHGQDSGLFALFADGLGVAAAPHDGLGVPRVELLFASEEPGHEEVEKRPELQDTVLDRCTGQDQPMVGLQGLDGQCGFRSGITNGVTLVQDQVIPMAHLEQIKITSDNFVRSDDGQGGLRSRL